MNEHQIAGIARTFMIDADAVRGFVIDMVETGQAPDADAAIDAAWRVMDGQATRDRVVLRGAEINRRAWDHQTDVMIDGMLTAAWHAYAESAESEQPFIGRASVPGTSPDEYQGKHAAE